MSELLDESTILAALPDAWNYDGKAIAREFTFGSFPDAIAFLTRIAPKAEAANHHPEIHNIYNRVTITLSTHDAGGVTRYDLDLAGQIDALA